MPRLNSIIGTGLSSLPGMWTGYAQNPSSGFSSLLGGTTDPKTPKAPPYSALPIYGVNTSGYEPRSVESNLNLGNQNMPVPQQPAPTPTVTPAPTIQQLSGTPAQQAAQALGAKGFVGGSSPAVGTTVGSWSFAPHTTVTLDMLLGNTGTTKEQFKADPLGWLRQWTAGPEKWKWQSGLNTSEAIGLAQASAYDALTPDQRAAAIAQNRADTEAGLPGGWADWGSIQYMPQYQAWQAANPDNTMSERDWWLNTYRPDIDRTPVVDPRIYD